MKINKLLSILKNHNYFPKYSRWIFILLFLLISIIYNYQEILFKPPQSIHLWRQADCLSITLNYYQDNNPFLEPSIHNLGRDGKGKTVSDFPLIYFTVAQLWKIFGQHEFIYRLFILLIFFSGLFALFRLLEEALRDSILAIVFSLLMFTSPTLAYYANNFLMDIPALSFAILGLYFFYKFYRTSSPKYLFLLALFYTLAGLLKISSLISFVAILGLFILERLNIKIKPQGRIFQKPGQQSLILTGVLMFPVIWYLYADYYNSVHNSGIFLVGILPLWEMDTSQIQVVFESIREHIRWDYFRPVTQVIFALMFISILIFYKKTIKTWLLMSILVGIGVLFFGILFFQALDQHDYYTINLFILIPIVGLTFLKLLKNNNSKVYSSV
ncbi:MAG: ArnT family glycosyltransferase, partial [Bacteroidales bacterium]